MTAVTSKARDIPRLEFIALIAAIMALNAIAIDVMLPALPYMGDALGILHENDRHFVLTSYMLGFGMAQLVFGPLSDRFGRRGPLVVGVTIYVVAALAATIAPNFATLLLLRFVQGLGAASTRVIATSVVRDRFGGRAMAEVMSIVFMVFMIVPILAPGIGQVILLSGPWEYIFLFMGGLGLAILFWIALRLPETLAPEHRRALRFSVIVDGFRIVMTNRMAISYGISGMFIFGALFGFISMAQQIYVDIFGLGALFPVAFAGVAGLMAVSSFLNSRIVRHVGMRRLSHFALIVFTSVSAVWLVLTLVMDMPLWLFLMVFATIMFVFGWAAANMNALSMEPLGKVAGTASSVFGFIQTSGGAVLGTIAGQFFDGTLTPVAAGYFILGTAALTSVLIAEKGRLFGVGEAYEDSPPPNR